MYNLKRLGKCKIVKSNFQMNIHWQRDRECFVCCAFLCCLECSALSLLLISSLVTIAPSFNTLEHYDIGFRSEQGSSFVYISGPRDKSNQDISNFTSCRRHILIIFPWFSCSSNVRCVRRNYIVQQLNNKTAQCSAHIQRSNPNTHMTSWLRWRASRTCSNTYDNRQVTCWQRNSQLLDFWHFVLCEVLTRNIAFSRKILIHYAILIVTIKI